MKFDIIEMTLNELRKLPTKEFSRRFVYQKLNSINHRYNLKLNTIERHKIYKELKKHFIKTHRDTFLINR